MAHQASGNRPKRTRTPQKSAGVRETAGHGAKSEVVRARAILALLSEQTISKAATKAGVSEKTLRRWLADDEAFKADYAAARRKTFEIGMGRVQAAAGRAIDTLEELLDDTDHPSVRLGAVRTLAELAIHQHDADVIMSKLDEIEEHHREQDDLS